MRTKIWSQNQKKTCLSYTAEDLAQINADSLEYMWEVMVSGNNDLQIHSNESDGHDSPPKIVQEVMKRNLDAFSITDHDAIHGFHAVSIVYDKLNQLGMDLPDFIPGIELDAKFEGQDLTILGYFPYATFWLMEDYIADRIADRNQRNLKTIELGQEAGLRLTEEDLNALGGGVISTVHIARLMMQKGYVDTVDEAYDVYLGEGKPLFVPRNIPEAGEVIQTIIEAGGVPVLGHPALYEGWLRGDNKMNREELTEKVSRLKDLGLQGIEVMGRMASYAHSRELAHVGTALDLLPTAGSDYHGSHWPNVHIRNENDDPRKFFSLFYEEFRN